ncbi:GDSL-type esterase/lipase family protein [Rhodopseudomonas sp. P2A-2r]|nr:GDSL-type esterase/lipase family protein [Rhodopseudomonas sp. P2A-2r]
MKTALLAAALLGAMAVTHTASAQVVALGASNTEGHGVGASEAYPAQLERMLQAKGKGMSVRNAGVFGDTSAGMLSRLSSSVPEGTKIVILQFGGNDMRQGITPPQRAANIASIQQQLRARGIKTVQADGYVKSALQSGMAQNDRIHLTAAGHQKVAAQLVGSIR